MKLITVEERKEYQIKTAKDRVKNMINQGKRNRVQIPYGPNTLTPKNIVEDMVD